MGRAGGPTGACDADSEFDSRACSGAGGSLSPASVKWALAHIRSASRPQRQARRDNVVIHQYRCLLQQGQTEQAGEPIVSRHPRPEGNERWHAAEDLSFAVPYINATLEVLAPQAAGGQLVWRSH